MVVHIPQHRNTFHVGGCALLPALQNLSAVALVVAYLNGIPGPRRPEGTLTFGLAVHAPSGIIGLLDVSAFIMDIHIVPCLSSATDEADGSAACEVLPKSNLPVFDFQIVTLPCGLCPQGKCANGSQNYDYD